MNKSIISNFSSFSADKMEKILIKMDGGKKEINRVI